MHENERPVVMIIEDEKPVARLYEDWIASDFDVRTASDGQAAMEEIDESVDVVLLDRRMPGPSGDDVLAAIRERGLDVRVSMVTAVAPDFDVVEMGIDDYVVKPVTRGELIATVERLLRAADYDDGLREYFSLLSKRAALESEKPAAELAESEKYDALLERTEEARSRLDDMVTDLHPEDYDALFRALAAPGESSPAAS